MSKRLVELFRFLHPEMFPRQVLRQLLFREQSACQETDAEHHVNQMVHVAKHKLDCRYVDGTFYQTKHTQQQIHHTKDDTEALGA